MRGHAGVMREGALADLFPAGVVAVIAKDCHWSEPLLAEEKQYVARAVAKRQREFAAGRACAREALARLGGPRVSLPVGLRGAPIWPEGFVGSISHSNGVCGAAVAPCDVLRGIGLDIEDGGPLEKELCSLVCRPDEMIELTGRANPPGTTWPKLLFSAKEAFYKCYFPEGRAILDFKDVQVSFGHNSFRGRIRRGSVHDPFGRDGIGGRWAVEGGRVVTTAYWVSDSLSWSSPASVDG